MVNFTSSSWFPLYKFKVGEGECHKDYMLGSTKYNGSTDFLTGERIMKYTTVIWNRILGITMTLDNYLKARASEDKDIQDKLKTAHLTCMLRM